MDNRIFGYIRVSTREQNISRQLKAMYDNGVIDRDLYIDKQSGKDFNRIEYQKMKMVLREGDMVIIKSIDRLGRNYTQILEEWNDITKNINADIIVLDMPLLDTRQHKDLLGTLINDIVLQLLSYVAENERDNIKKRQAEGIAIAQEKGIKFGRPNAKYPDNWDEVYKLWKAKKIKAIGAMKELNLKKTTFYKLVKEYEQSIQ